MPDVHVIPMTLEHIPAVERLEKLCFSLPRSARSLAIDLQNPAARLLVALHHGIITGYAGFHFVLDEGYIDNVAVFPEYRRLGVGRGLMDALDNQAARLDLSFLTLEVRVSNAGAIRLYESCGYTCAGRRPGFYTTPPEDAFLYTKTYRQGSGPT